MLNLAHMRKTHGDSVDGLLLGQNVRRLRLAHKWTLRQLAEAAGMTQGYITRLEGGIHPHPSRGTAEKLAAAFGVEVEELTGPPPSPIDIGELKGIEADLWQIVSRYAKGEQADELFYIFRNTLAATGEGQAKIREYMELLKGKYIPVDVVPPTSEGGGGNIRRSQ